MIVKALILFTMFIILTSLGRGLYCLLIDKGRTERTVQALSWRIALSLGLFILLIVGALFGYIQPHAPGF